jgi:hypothetical protein
MVTFCENASKFASMTGDLTQTLWPTVSPLPPYGGVVIALTSRTNVVIDICDFVLRFSEWDNQQKIFGTKSFLNDLTGKKFDDDFTFFDDTFNIANSVYDFDNGDRREGALTSAASMRDMSDYQKRVQEYVGKKTGSQADNVNSSSNAATQEFSNIVAENTTLKSAMNCPDASKNPNYNDIYEKEIRPQEEKRTDADNDITFYKDRLYELGKAMFDGSGDVGQYIHAIDDLDTIGIFQNVGEDSYTEETYKPTQRKDAKGHTIKKQVILTRKYQVFTAGINQEPFTRLQEGYKDKWDSYVKWTFLQNSTQFGVFAGADKRVEKTFRVLSYECSEKKLMGNIDPKRYDYEEQYDKKRKECEENYNSDEKKEANLLQFYFDKYKTALYLKEDATSKIWTLESRYLKVTRVVTQKSGNNFVKENVKCSEELTVAEMEKLSLKLKDNTIKMREGIFKNKQKDNIATEQVKKQNSDSIKDYDRKRLIIEQKREEDEKGREVQGSITPVRGGLGTSNQ